MKKLYRNISVSFFLVFCLFGCSDMLSRFLDEPNNEEEPLIREYYFDIALEWHWESSLVEPNFVQVMCAPVVADLNQDNIPDII